MRAKFHFFEVVTFGTLRGRSTDQKLNKKWSQKFIFHEITEVRVYGSSQI